MNSWSRMCAISVGILASFQPLVDRFEHRVRWRVADLSDSGRPSCTTAAPSLGAIGEQFEALERRDAVISADVLDAWFDPAPSVLRKIADHLAFAMKTSPPTHSEGLRRTIAAIGSPRVLDPAWRGIL